MRAAFKLTPHPDWVQQLQEYCEPDWQKLLHGEWSQGIEHGTWTVEEMKSWMLHFYPFIHAFPKFLALALVKAQDDYSRAFLIQNIAVEKTHAEHWLWMGKGFGVDEAEMLAVANGERRIVGDVQSLTDYLWRINTEGTLAEAVAATSFAVEGITGDVTERLLPAFEAYGARPGVDMSPRTSKWFRNHARYDDDHPEVAMEIVKTYAQSPTERMKVMNAAKRSLELLHQALLSATRPFGIRPPTLTVVEGGDRRRDDRRSRCETIGFPDRRMAARRSAQPSPR